MNTQNPSNQTKVSLDQALYVEFLNAWKKIPPNTLRLGQYFHQYFDLQKSTAFKDEYDALYQLDGEKARAKIRELFEI